MLSALEVTRARLLIFFGGHGGARAHFSRPGWLDRRSMSDSSCLGWLDRSPSSDFFCVLAGTIDALGTTFGALAVSIDSLRRLFVPWLARRMPLERLLAPCLPRSTFVERILFRRLLARSLCYAIFFVGSSIKWLKLFVLRLLHQLTELNILLEYKCTMKATLVKIIVWLALLLGDVGGPAIT